MACKKKDQDPAACLELGAKCTGCMIDVMKELSAGCRRWGAAFEVQGPSLQA
jgi:hypothetical protein